jgi:hypothetical protein
MLKMIIRNGTFFVRIKKEIKIFFLSIFICNIIYFINIYTAKNINHVIVQFYETKLFTVFLDKSKNEIFNSLTINYPEKILKRYKSEENFNFSDIKIKKNPEGFSINYIITQRSFYKTSFELNLIIDNVIQTLLVDMNESIKKNIQEDIEFLNFQIKVYETNVNLSQITGTKHQELYNLIIKKQEYENLVEIFKMTNSFPLQYTKNITKSEYPLFKSFFIHNLFGIILFILFIYLKKDFKILIK